MRVCKLKGCEELSEDDLRVLATRCGEVEDIGVGCIRFKEETSAIQFSNKMDGMKLSEREPIKATVVSNYLFWNIRFWNYYCDWCSEIVPDLDLHIKHQHINILSECRSNIVTSSTSFHTIGKTLLRRVACQDRIVFNKKCEIPQLLENIINKTSNDRFSIFIFGSCAQHTASTTSDIDLYVSDSKHPNPSIDQQRSSLTELYQIITNYSNETNHGFELLLKAASPIITYSPTGVEGYPIHACDISLSNNGIKNTSLIGEYVKNSSILRSLIFTSKSELNGRVINPKIGMLSSYAVTVIIIKYCLDQGLVDFINPKQFESQTTLPPPQYMNWDPPDYADFGKHWFGLLHFIKTLSDGKCVSITDPVQFSEELIFSSNSSNRRTGKNNFRNIQIIDPYETGRNLASGIGYARTLFITKCVEDLIQKHTVSATRNGDEVLQQIQNGKETDSGENWYAVAINFLSEGRDLAEKYAAVCADRLLTEIKSSVSFDAKKKHLSLLCDLLLRYSEVSDCDTSMAVLSYSSDCCPAMVLKARISPNLGKELFHHAISSNNISLGECGEDQMMLISNLSLLLKEYEVIHISGQTLSRVALVIFCIERFPMNYKFWKCLSWILSLDSPAVSICSRMMSPLEVIIKTLEMQFSNGELLASAAPDLIRLSEWLSDSEEVELFGRQVTASSCRAAANMMTT